MEGIVSSRRNHGLLTSDGKLINYFVNEVNHGRIECTYSAPTYTDILDVIKCDGLEITKDISYGDILVCKNEDCTYLIEVQEDDDAGWIGTCVKVLAND